MCLNFNDYQFNTSRYSYTLTYMKFIITKNQKPAIDTQKLKRKEHKHNIKIIKSQQKRLKEEKNREELQNPPENK